jgi:hypothetical protein
MAETNGTAAKTQHPLAVTRTELVWEGKYDSAGNRVAPLRVALPFQTVETVTIAQRPQVFAVQFEEVEGVIIITDGFTIGYEVAGQIADVV